MLRPDVDPQRARKRLKLPESLEPRLTLTSSLQQATEDRVIGMSATNTSNSLPTSKVTLKGRKKYNSDISGMEGSSQNGFEYNGLQVRDFRASEDDSTFECKIMQSRKLVVSLSFFVSDTSDYPTSHTFFCHCTDDQAPSAITPVTERLHEEPARTIEDMLRKLLSLLAKALANDQNHVGTDDEEIEEDEIELFEEQSDDDFGIILQKQSSTDYGLLQNHFNKTVTYGYRPGFIPFGVDDFVLSVSIPVVKLANDIPARALMAWDRRLLSEAQHLTLLVTGLRGMYPVLQADGTVRPNAATLGTSPKFRLGLTPMYKPQKEHVAEIIRTFGLKELPVPRKEGQQSVEEMDSEELEENEEPEVEQSSFQPFSLSASLETLLNQRFLRIVQLRLEHQIGWAGAETLAWEAEKLQKRPVEVLTSMRKQIFKADENEAKLASSYVLPPDPLLEHEEGAPLNLLLLAFCYLVRRLTLCPRYCIVCHDELKTDYESLKPYVCDSKLCIYQYYNLNRGPSLEYEICANTEVVDLLVSLTYTAASSHAMEGALPVGLGLSIPPMTGVTGEVDADGLVDFDKLNAQQMCIAITKLLDMLPPIVEMKQHLEKAVPVGRLKPKLRDIKLLPLAAWLLLRWCVGSCTAHLEELREGEDRITSIDSSWRQFRFSAGSPDAEAKLKNAISEAQRTDKNARRFPSLYAFHGSRLANWHSIIRHGLWFKKVTNGRAYGHGVYFAKDGLVSTGYASSMGNTWARSALAVQSCMALAQIVNLPSQFVSTSPYFVVKHTHWIICRYLLVKSSDVDTESETNTDGGDVPYVPLDPAHPVTMGGKAVQIPDPSFKLGKLLSARRDEYLDVDYDADDMSVFNAGDAAAQSATALMRDDLADDWIHDPEWVKATIEHMLPPPTEASPQATMALQRELKAMLNEQGRMSSLGDLGWYMPPDFVGDNLFQWIVELHSFEKDLPLAKDMEARGVNSLVFEIRFPPTFPHSPPFFRILKPRLLPFIQGGGGHVTGGGSMCMDLLTTDGWLPSYSISAILLQIRLAISNREPRPARLASNWDVSYKMQEALEGYKRAANTHGWKVPRGLDRLAY